MCFLLLQLTREEISGPEFPVNRQDSSEVSKTFFELAIRRFESCQVSHPVQSPENLLLKCYKGPPIAGFSRCAKSLIFRLSNFWHVTFPKVSTNRQENSRFLETRCGDQRIRPLRGRLAVLFRKPRIAFTWFKMPPAYKQTLLKFCPTGGHSATRSVRPLRLVCGQFVL